MYLRNAIARGQPWDVMVDLFLYRAPEEQEKEESTEPQFQRGPIFEDNAEWTAAPPQEYIEQQQQWAQEASTAEWGNAENPTSWDNTEQ